MDLDNINVPYLLDWCLDNSIENEDELIELVLGSAAYPEAYIYNFHDIIYEFDVYDYWLHDIIHDDKLQQDIYIFKIDTDEEKDAFMTQVFDIPNLHDWTETRFCIFVSTDVIDNKFLYDYMTGHELAHIDFFNLPKYKNHYNQMRYVMIETYCDIRSLECMNIEDRKCAVEMILRDMGRTFDYPVDVHNMREFETRMWMIRQFMKGKINSSIIANYVTKNYKRHMEFLNNVQKEHDNLMKHYLFRDDLGFESSQEAYDLKGIIAHRILEKFYI